MIKADISAAVASPPLRFRDAAGMPRSSHAAAEHGAFLLSRRQRYT